MPEANKVHFGLKNVHYAKITYTDGVPSWGTPVAVPGGVSLTLSKNSASTDFYADNIKYFHLMSNNGYTGSIEMADFPVQMLQDIWGFSVTNTGKMLTEKAGQQGAEFALMFEVDGDQEPNRYCLYRCSADRPDINANTVGESVDVQTQTADLTVMPVSDPTDGSIINNMVRYSTTADTPAAKYSAFFDAVDTTLT